MSIPYMCVGCEKTDREVENCRIRLVQFTVFGMRCPREKPIEAISPPKEPKPAGFEPATPKEAIARPRQGPEPPKVMAEAVAGDQYLELPTELIYWEDPIRKDIRKEDVDDMATSFTMHGQIEPIVVEGPDEEGKYEGVCGRLRYEAMKRFPGRPILARVHLFKSAREKREWQLAENLHRRDLTALERAEAYRELYESMREELGGVHDKHIVFTIAKRQEELAGERLSERIIYDYISITELPEEVKKIAVDRKFGLEHGKQLLRLKDMPEKQLELAEEFASEPMTVSQLKKRVDEILNPPEPKRPWQCYACHGEFLEETRTTMVLCPYCVMELQAWLAERKVENKREVS